MDDSDQIFTECSGAIKSIKEEGKKRWGGGWWWCGAEKRVKEKNTESLYLDKCCALNN